MYPDDRLGSERVEKEERAWLGGWGDGWSDEMDDFRRFNNDLGLSKRE